jgi:hypothetical protein
MSAPVLGIVETKNGKPYLYCENLDEHDPRDIVVIFDNLSKEELTKRIEADDIFHYPCCPKCKREVLFSGADLRALPDSLV